MTAKRDYDATVARIAGNLLSSEPLLFRNERMISNQVLVSEAVALARAIVAEVQRTDPAPVTQEEPK